MAPRGNRGWPYRRVVNGEVKAGNWMLNPATEHEQELPNALPDWDYQTTLKLRRHVTTRPGDVRKATGLPEAAPLALAVRWHVVPSHLRGAAAWLPLSDDQEEWTVDIELPGQRLGGALRLETAVVLADEVKARPATAHRAGSNLWSDAVDIRLQGNAALYPVALVPFSKSALPDKAAWFLELGADLEAAAMGAIQLLVNQEHATVAAAVGRASNPTEVDRAVLSTLRSDVFRSMVERALGDEAFSLEMTFEDDTLGAVLQGLLKAFFPDLIHGDDLTEIRRMRDNDAPLFATFVQAATELLVEQP